MTADPFAHLRAGSRVRGLVPGRAVTLVAVDVLDAGQIAEVFFRDDGGRSASRMLDGADAAAIETMTHGDRTPFDADPDEFLLAAEALRIKHAARYDPMAAVNGSDVDPLPHQIRAVYEELLPRIPLRFLLADDPGAGKTIMAGLYLKELMLRSDCARAIVVAPGGLVEQWREELATKFDLRFEIFSRAMLDETPGNVFREHPYLIARMDQLARNDELMEQLAETAWDVAVVDEAHRMSARYSSWSGEVDETRRFRLGRVLSDTAHHLLLMTATPHAGKEEDFQLFCSLLDRDRFEGQFRRGVHRTDTTGLMRRMVKEDLLTFEGKPLFPERRATTVGFALSDGESSLYEQVTEYVRTEMGRAERIAAAGDGKRGNTVGFALTVLQRRLASSPEAILRSLERRRDRLGGRLRDLLALEHAGQARGADVTHLGFDVGLPVLDIAADGDTRIGLSLDEYDDLDAEIGEDERARFEESVDAVTDLATAAQTIPELRAEITILDDLVAAARRVRHRDEDAKWVQLRAILDKQVLGAAVGQPRKIIVFTEHRDTLTYLEQKIGALLGRPGSVITIHGGTSREARKAAREAFTHDPGCVVLLATDAAGEGLNLQRAHLMVNYDLPWNPNRIEQRFGRIHRIGQREVCHLWNLVARGTREGDVYARLLDKIGSMSAAYNGNLFNVLGEGDAFAERSLRDLLIEAIRYGDQPAVKARLDRVIDAGVSGGLDDLLAERALHPEMFSALDLDEVRARMEQARERRLQPGFIRGFFLPAFTRLGGRARRRESGRYEITRVPTRLIDLARRIDRWNPVAERYERITFERDLVAPAAPTGSVRHPVAALIAPGHPLLAAVIEATVEDLGGVLSSGTVLVDRRADAGGGAPALLYAVEQRITAGAGDDAMTVSHQVDYPVLTADGSVTVPAAPPYLDLDRPTPDEAARITALLSGEGGAIPGWRTWARDDHDRTVRAWAFREGARPRLDELEVRRAAETARTRSQVTSRLLAEINHWDREYNRLADLERQGTIGRLRAETARARARHLDERLEARLRELDAEAHLAAAPAVIRGRALVVPAALLPTTASHDADGSAPETDGGAEPPAHARSQEAIAAVERRAVDAVLAAERSLGRVPEEMPRNNPGFDVRSTDSEGRTYFIEVKGRIAGADTFQVTANEVSFAHTQGDRHRLALVAISPDGPAGDEVRYVTDAFTHLEPSATTRAYTELLPDYWTRGGLPR